MALSQCWATCQLARRSARCAYIRGIALCPVGQGIRECWAGGGKQDLCSFLDKRVLSREPLLSLLWRTHWFFTCSTLILVL
jgi:hypothetical protein